MFALQTVKNLGNTPIFGNASATQRQRKGIFLQRKPETRDRAATQAATQCNASELAKKARRSMTSTQATQATQIPAMVHPWHLIHVARSALQRVLAIGSHRGWFGPRLVSSESAPRLVNPRAMGESAAAWRGPGAELQLRVVRAALCVHLLAPGLVPGLFRTFRERFSRVAPIAGNSDRVRQVHSGARGY